MVSKEGIGRGIGVFGFISCAVLLSFFYIEARAAESGGLIFRASKIIDHAVKNEQGEEVGEVDDLIMSRRGKIKKVVLSVGGFLGIGDRLVAVPFRSLRIHEKGEIIYNVTKEQLEKHPIFDYRKEDLFEYYYSPPPFYGRYGRGYIPPPQYGTPYGEFPGGRYRGRVGPWQWEYFPERLRVSAVLDRQVLNEGGEEVGEIDDLLINGEGWVQEIVLSVGGFLGVDEKLVTLPFKPLKITDLGIVYDVTRAELEKRPAFKYEG
jgi:sporulation protein YlmC with PRC-barrel domain